MNLSSGLESHFPNALCLCKITSVFLRFLVFFFFLPNCKVSLLHHVCGNGDIRMNAILHFSLLPVTLIMCRPFVYLLDENLADLET